MSRLLQRIAPSRAQPDDGGPGARAYARRRLRHLRQLRELQLRDLGGFVFDLYRFGEKRDRLVREKLDAIIATDKERQALEALLDDRRPSHEIRQPGIGGACPACGDFHGPGARYCARCGTELAREEAGQDTAARRAEAGADTVPLQVVADEPEPREGEAVELAAVPQRRGRAKP